MTERPTCATCRWWEAEDEDLGRCHIRSVPLDNFPQRFGDEWCGEHTPRETESEDVD